MRNSRMLGMVVGVLALAALAASPAQAQVKSKVIDADSLVIKPTETATGILGGTAQFASRVIAGTLDNNGFIKTINNLFGKNNYGPPVQNGLSPLPPITSYPSTFFKSPLTQAMPKYMTVPR